MTRLRLVLLDLIALSVLVLVVGLQLQPSMVAEASATPSSSALALPVQPVGFQVTPNSDIGVNIRKCPSTGCEIIGALAYGDTASASGWTTSYDATWIQVGTDRWVYAGAVEVVDLSLTELTQKLPFVEVKDVPEPAPVVSHDRLDMSSAEDIGGGIMGIKFVAG